MSGAGSESDAVQPFVDSLTAAGKAAVSASAGNPQVSAAVDLGWLMKELAESWPHDALPGGLSLAPAQQCQVQALRLTTLLGALKLTDLDPASVAPVIAALQTGPAPGPATTLESSLIVAMLGADPRLAKAFLLGAGLRALIPDGGTGAGQGADGGTAHDTKRLVGALDALSSDLPSHAARSVANSLGEWSLSTDAHKAALAAAQVGLWRSVIVGAKKGTELLEPDDYLAAARQLERRFARRALTSKWLWTVIAAAIVLFGLGIYVLFGAHGQAGKVAAGASGVLAAVGLTWKGIGGTLGKLVGKLEAPLWGAELDTAISDVITLTKTPNGKPGGDSAGLGYADRRGRALRAHPTSDQRS